MLAVATAVWQVNNIAQTSRRRLVDTPLFHANDHHAESSGLSDLLAETSCSVLYLNDPRLTAAMITTAMSGAEKPPRRVIVGPRALAGHCGAEDLVTMLDGCGYAVDEDAPLNAAVSLLLRS